MHLLLFVMMGYVLHWCVGGINGDRDELHRATVLIHVDGLRWRCRPLFVSVLAMLLGEWHVLYRRRIAVSGSRVAVNRLLLLRLRLLVLVEIAISRWRELLCLRVQWRLDVARLNVLGLLVLSSVVHQRGL